MEDNTSIKSSFSAPAHCSAGATTRPDGRRMSINVEILGGNLIHAALHINIPNYASAIVTKNEVVDSISSLHALGMSAQD